jgi:glycosyltransferase involved in cell wall biosynthesis
MRKEAKPRVLVAHISPGPLASFVQTDVEIFQEFADVRMKFFGSWIDIPGLAFEVARADLVVCWFAWSQAFWATKISRLLGKPSIIISGGFELVGIPEIRYGGQLDRRNARRVRDSLQTATEVVAVSRSIQEDVIRLSGRSDSHRVPLGFDPTRHPFSTRKERLAITVGSVTESNLSRKGILEFVEIAKSFPEVPFLAVGALEDDRGRRVDIHLPPNVRLTGHVGDEELSSLMQRAKVYVQLSAHEGFGSAVAEAMLAGCIPVVTDRGALPEVVGDCGFVVPWRDKDAATAAVSQALDCSAEASRQCRERISREFHLDNRRQALSEIAGRLLARYPLG